MKDILPWMIAHIACTLAHFVFFLAATYAFVSPPNFDAGFQRTHLTWMSSAVVSLLN